MMNNRIFLVVLVLLLSASAQQNTLFVESILLEGNDSIPGKQLLPLMQLQPPGFFERSPYSFTTLTTDLSAIERYYHRNGYLHASVTIAELDRRPSQSTVVIRLQINEGPRTMIDSIKFQGNRVFSDSVFSGFVPLDEGGPLDSLLYKRSADIIQDSLASQGHLFSEVKQQLKFYKDRTRVSVIYTIDEGPVVMPGDLEIVGADDIRRRVITRELDLDRQSPLTASVLSQAMSRLYGTGLFDYVRIEPSDTGTAPSYADTITVPVLVQVRLSNMFSLQVGSGYNTDNGLYGTGEVSYRNVFALGHRITLSGQASFDLIGTQLIYSYPWFLGAPVYADLMLYIERQEEMEFSGLFRGGLFSLAGRLTRLSRYRAWLQVENTVWITEPPATNIFPDVPQGNMALAGIGLTRDTRNIILNPDRGTYAALEGELAGPAIPWSDKFYKVKCDLRTYYSFFSRQLKFASALFAGYVNGYGPAGDAVPTQELFRVSEDAVRPVRGYSPEMVASPDENGAVRGGRLVLILTPVEITFPVYSILNAALFADGGYVWATLKQFSMRDLQWSVGPGVRINLPIGIGRLDYGIRLDGDSDLDGQFHFGIGASF
jgi:outer membrane protein assembly complex protein YaeT